MPDAATLQLPERHLKPFSNDDINALPLRRYEGPVHLVTSEKQLQSALRRLRDEPILGFDTETRPTFRKGVIHDPSLIQLACADCVYLFQLSKLPFQDGLKELFSDAGLVKTGVSVRDDIKDLQKLSPFDDAAVVDLGEISHELNMQTHGLRNLAANLLGFRISKSAQCSNWAKENLSPQQIVYAATDAWVSREIYMAFRTLGVFPD